MSELKTLRVELVHMNELLAAARAREVAAVLARFREEATLLGITKKEVRRALGYDRPERAAAKYCDPSTGESGPARVRARILPGAVFVVQGQKEEREDSIVNRNRVDVHGVHPNTDSQMRLRRVDGVFLKTLACKPLNQEGASAIAALRSIGSGSCPSELPGLPDRCFDWNTLNRLHDRGLIGDPVNKAKSVILTAEGLRESERLFNLYFVASGRGSNLLA